MTTALIQSYFLIISKYFLILGSIIYLVFAMVIVKQVKAMSRQVYDKLNPVLTTISLANLIVSLFLIILTILVL